jgi:uncharacterized protein
MKSSRYNIFIATDQGTHLLFNSASAALAEISSEHIEAVRRILKCPDASRSEADEELFHTLCEGRFLIPGEIDELAVLTVRNRRQRFSGETLFLTIAPTLACNFRCDYCFEDPQAASMTPETEDALLKFAEHQATRAEKLLVTWFGGEPTLRMDTVERLQTRLRHLADRRGLEMLTTGMVTNGYCLDRTMALHLKELGITDVQVTLDGPRHTHDARRKLAGGGGTFDRIIANLRETVGLLQITIRVNVDRDNAEAALDLVEELQRTGVLPEANLYFAPVNDNSGPCPDLCHRCFTTEEFSKTQTCLYERLAERGLIQIEYPMLAPGGHCGADAENAFVIAPSGDIFKCWEEVSMDRSRSIGSVYFGDLAPQQESNLDMFLSWDPLQMAECRDCRVLPICMGGCPRQGITQKTLTSGACSSWKYNLEEMLLLQHRLDMRKEVTE